MPDNLSLLTHVNLDDLVSAFGWQNSPRLAAALRTVFRPTAEKFARQMLAFDSLVGDVGLQQAARHALQQYLRAEHVFGVENIPPTGPVLLLSNHPGMVDTLALFAAIARNDLRIIALNRPFLQALPHTSTKLFYVSDNPGERMAVVRKVSGYLRNGGAVLTFPAGRIEPDPAVYPGARQSLETWTDSAGVFLRFAPETQIVPALVSSVLWDKAVRHPLTMLKPPGEEREKLGAAFQLLAHIMFDIRPLTVRVQFGAPLSVDEIGSTNVEAIHAAVVRRMSDLLQAPPDSGGQLLF